MPYSARYESALGASHEAFAGMGAALGVEALAGDTDLATAFEDFNQLVPSVTFGEAGAAGLRAASWELSDVGVPVADEISINVGSLVFAERNSLLYILAGTAADTGGNAQLYVQAVPEVAYNGIFLPANGVSAAVLDNTVVTLAARVGLMSNGATWDGKFFFGFAQSGDVQILVSATGAIVVPTTGSLLGFHVAEDGHIDLINARGAVDPMVNGTNFTLMQDTTWNAGLTAEVPVWFDLALRATYTDMSDATANGSCRAAIRRVRPTSLVQPGVAPSEPARAAGGRMGRWQRVTTVLRNQLPNDATILVPTLELQNGPVRQSRVAVDWWAMGVSRPSRA